ncbi:MAG: DUF362 domain-containing protein, partial [Spirochaetales bacterium]|nr:DUF362 domain-containing protein [Spirochaetales bacterium]
RFPKFIKIKMNIERPVLQDVYSSAFEEVSKVFCPASKDMRIAIAIGSRGIANIDTIAKATADAVKEKGCRPFIVAAMGSHGNGTVEGQLEVLEAYGITEKTMGYPVVAADETVELPAKRFEFPLHINKKAWESDGIIVVNRVKKHTDIHGEHESGLLKMMAIGLGYKTQANLLHRNGMDYLYQSIIKIAADTLDTGKILCGLGIVENAFGETALVRGCTADDMFETDKDLLKYSKQISAKLPVEDLDVLVIDEGGKDKSGSCIETNVIGRMDLWYETELTSPRIKRIALLGLTEKSHGNGAGVGLADFITKRFFDAMDLEPGYTNCITSSVPERAKIPVIMKNDAEAIHAAMSTCRFFDWDNPRIIRIHDTNNLEYMLVSPAVYKEIQNLPFINLIEDGLDIVDDNGDIVPF